MKTNQNTFFGIIAALIAVIFTIAAFAACKQPTDETTPVDETDMGTYGELKIVNETGKPKVGYEALKNKILTAYNNIKSQRLLKSHIDSGGLVKIVLGTADGHSKDDNLLTITFNADLYAANISDQYIIGDLQTIIENAQIHITD